MARLATLVAEASGLDHVFFCNSGAEANEGAIKLARKWGQLRRGGAFELVTTHGAFHGRTLATMAASGKPAFEPLFEPKAIGFVKVPLNDLDAVAAAITARTVGVMLEPIQGEAGVVPATDEYLQALRALTRERGVLLILDEIQTGIGRTGSFFSFEQDHLRPDAITLAKGLGGGLPIGAILFLCLYYYYGPVSLTAYLSLYILCALLFIVRSHLTYREHQWRQCADSNRTEAA